MVYFETNFSPIIAHLSQKVNPGKNNLRNKSFRKIYTLYLYHRKHPLSTKSILSRFDVVLGAIDETRDCFMISSDIKTLRPIRSVLMADRTLCQLLKQTQYCFRKSKWKIAYFIWFLPSIAKPSFLYSFILFSSYEVLMCYPSRLSDIMQFGLSYRYNVNRIWDGLGYQNDKICSFGLNAKYNDVCRTSRLLWEIKTKPWKQYKLCCTNSTTLLQYQAWQWYHSVSALSRTYARRLAWRRQTDTSLQLNCSEILRNTRLTLYNTYLCNISPTFGWTVNGNVFNRSNWYCRPSRGRNTSRTRSQLL